MVNVSNKSWHYHIIKTYAPGHIPSQFTICSYMSALLKSLVVIGLVIVFCSFVSMVLVSPIMYYAGAPLVIPEDLVRMGLAWWGLIVAIAVAWCTAKVISRWRDRRELNQLKEKPQTILGAWFESFKQKTCFVVNIIEEDEK